MNNIFIIGTTNRLELIDPALKRAGRLELNLKIDLPDMEGRKQILQIHTKKLKSRSLLGDIDFETLARKTDGWSGADLSGLTKKALSSALYRAANGDMESIEVENILVEQGDFDRRLEEGQGNRRGDPFDFIDNRRMDDYVPYGDGHNKAYKLLKSFASKVHKDGFGGFVSCLLEGPIGTGKTYLASTIARDSGFSYVRMVSNQYMVGLDTSTKKSIILKVLEAALNSTSSLIVLDDIERLIEYSAGGEIAKLLVDFLTYNLPQGKKMFVIGTTRDRSLLKSANIFDVFSVKLKIPELDKQGIESVLMKVLPSGLFKEKEIKDAATRISHVSIKNLYIALDYAKDDTMQFNELSLQICLSFLEPEMGGMENEEAEKSKA